MSEESKKRKLQEIEETCTSFRKSHFLRKHIRIDKILELMKILAAKDCNQVVESDKVLSALFDSFATGNVLLWDFSALENDDVDSLLHLENKGPLVFEDSVKVVPSQHFLATLTKLQRRWNMS
ncbi:4109_t:CDS:2, partial [Paraglomus occultum]